MGGGVSTVSKEEVNVVNLPSHIQQERISKNLLICSKAAGICQLSYSNSVRSRNNIVFENENKKNFQISEYKIWTYSAFSDLVLETLLDTPAVSAQCTTGVISNLSPDMVDPIPFICFRGTASLYDIIADFNNFTRCDSYTLKGSIIGNTGTGISEHYQTLRAFGLIEYIVTAIKKYKTGLLITGHSLGGAISCLLLGELLADYPELFEYPTYVVTFGCPRVFSLDSATKFLKILTEKDTLTFVRVVNENDFISMIPSVSSQTLYHIGEPYFFGGKDVEIHSIDLDWNFPPDAASISDTIVDFLFSKGIAHKLDTEKGYFTRLVGSGRFMQMLKNLDAKSVKVLEKLSRSITKYRIQSLKSHYHVPQSQKQKSLIDHFFGERSLMQCRMWTNTTDLSFSYPESSLVELMDKDDIGISLSGGGLRAACLALGWLRALHNLGVLAKAKYVSSISGGSWTHVPMTYHPAKQPLDTFLGPYVPPALCTVREVEKSVSSGHGKVLADNNFIPKLLLEGLENITPTMFHSREVDYWSEAVGKAYLAPHGFNVDGSSLPALDGDHADRIRSITSSWIDTVYSARPLNEHPFPIVNGSVLVGSNRGCLPVEFTPMYHGIIPYYEDSHRSLGGCLIEPHGFSSKPDSYNLNKQLVCEEGTSENQARCVELQIPQPNFSVTMHEIAGISSSYLAQTYGDKLDDNAYELANFPVLPTFNHHGKGDSLVSREKFVDGGGCDNSGMLALLRRRCKFVIACYAMNSSVEPSNPPIEDANLHSWGALAGLFGRQCSSKRVNMVKKESFNEQRKVFAAEAWDELIGALRAKRADGKPLVHRMTLDVLPNPLIAVPGQHKVEVVFCISGECKDWSDALPKDTKTLLMKDNATALSDIDEKKMQSGLMKCNLNKFPYFPVGRLFYSKLTAGMMSQLATYQIMETAKEFNFITAE